MESLGNFPAAREMLTVRLARFNAWLREQDLGPGFRMGIGLNSGRVMSGNVGSERRVEYAAVAGSTLEPGRFQELYVVHHALPLPSVYLVWLPAAS